jgi:hypothetical protein
MFYFQPNNFSLLLLKKPSASIWLRGIDPFFRHILADPALQCSPYLPEVSFPPFFLLLIVNAASPAPFDSQRHWNIVKPRQHSASRALIAATLKVIKVQLLSTTVAALHLISLRGS